MVTTTDTMVRYEGDEPGADHWGMTQANFTVVQPGQPHAREIAVQLNNAGAAFAAEALGVEDTSTFRRAATMALGQRVLEAEVSARARIEPLVTVSRATLEHQPELLEAIRAALAA